MTRGSVNPIVPPCQDPKSDFHIKKHKKVDELTSTFEFDTFEQFEKSPNKKGIGCDPETEDDSKEDIKCEEEEIANITMMTM